MSESAVMRGTAVRVEFGRPGTSLTDREREVLSTYARLGDYRRVAEACAISYQTVKNHMSSIYGRLEVGGAFEAFHKLGWLTPPSLDEVAVMSAAQHGLDAIARLESLRDEIAELLEEMRAPGSDVGTSPAGDPVDELEQGIAATPAPSLRRVI